MKKISELIVVEIASVLAGPSVGMFFAELGAKVIKIEPKHIGGDVTRSWKLPSEKSASNISAYFASVNYHKEYHFYDFRDETDYKETYNFIQSADILITNFKHGDDVKFNLDFESVKKINETIIYGSISGFGDESDRVAYDLILQAETGFMFMNGTPESGPVKMPVALIDILAGHQLKEGILLALLTREKQSAVKVSVSLFDAAIASLANQASNYLMAGHIAQPIGSLHPNIAPYGEIFETVDGAQVTFAIGSQKQFEKLVTFLGLTDLLNQENYQTNNGRVKHRTVLAKEIGLVVQKRPIEAILQYCHQHYIPAAQIKSIDQVFGHKAAKNMVLEEEIEGTSTKRVKTVAFKLL